MARRITRDDISTALQQEESGIPLEKIIEDSGVSRRTFLKMRTRYSPLSDLLRDLRSLQEENLRQKQTITDLTIALCKLRDQLDSE